MFLFKRIKMGFTLSEVLVTLAVIGVVFVLTLPQLIQNYKKKVYVTQLHSVYNLLSQALLAYQTDSNAVNLVEAGLQSQEAAEEFILNYFKVVETCETTSGTPCFAGLYKTISGKTILVTNTKSKSYRLANGTAIRATYNGEYNTANNGFITMAVDVNGSKAPNTRGRDYFVLHLYSNRVIDDAELFGSHYGPPSREARERMFNTYCLTNTQLSYGCFGKILNDDWEMNY